MFAEEIKAKPDASGTGIHDEFKNPKHGRQVDKLSLVYSSTYARRDPQRLFAHVGHK